MDDPTPTARQVLDGLADRADLVALEAWLTAADAAERSEALLWARSHGGPFDGSFGDHRPGEEYETGADRRWFTTVVIASTAAPGKAVKRLAWNDFWFVSVPQRDLLVRTLVRRPRDWAATVLPLAAGVRLGSRREPDTAPFLFYLLDALIRAHDLPVPDGDAFLDGWARAGADLSDPLYTPVLLAPLLCSPHLRHRADLPDRLDDLVAAGSTRTEVLTAALEALTRPGTPAAQRVLAQLLRRLEPDVTDLAGRLPLLLTGLATAHGSVTDVLLPLALDLVRTEPDLDEIARTVTARPEKKQLTGLLRALQDPQLVDRVGRAAVAAAAAHFELVDDSAIRQRAAALRSSLGAPDVTTTSAEDTTPSYDGLWSPADRHRPEPGRIDVPQQLDHRAVGRLLGNQWSRDHLATRGEVDVTGEAVLLECLLRAASGHGPARIREWLPGHDASTWHGIQPLAGALIAWLRGDLDDGPVYHSRIIADFYNDAEFHWQGRQLLVNFAARECLSRAGRLTTVLSTPSHVDGTLALDVLLERIVSGSVSDYTPHDLALSLLRLAPLEADSAARLGALDDRALPADPVCWAEHVGGDPVAAPDGLDLVREWVNAGGIRPLATTWTLDLTRPYPADSWSWDAERPPYPAAVLDRLHLDHRSLLSGRSLPPAIVAPTWHDLGSAGAPGQRPAFVTDPAHLLPVGSVLGTPGHASLLLPLANTDAAVREAAVARLLGLVAVDVLDGPRLAEAAETLNRAGLLPLRRVAQGLEQAFASGGLADLWGPGVRIAAEAAVRRPLPAGLPDLLRVLSAYAPAVPDPSLPPALEALATAKGSTKSHAEARALAATVAATVTVTVTRSDA